MEEKRRVERHELNLKIAEIDDRPGSIAVILDISSLGAKIESNFKFAVDELLEFNLISSLPVLTGRVAWINQESDNPASYLVGISFTEPFSACHDLIALHSEYHQLQQEQKERIDELEQQLTKRRSWWRRLWGRD
jgi:hypothetical protein